MSAARHRLAKVIAQRGVCSRREAGRWILEGRVHVNGVLVETPATLVVDTDLILIDHKPLKAKPKIKLWLYHKPRGLITTHHDPQGRPTVFDHLSALGPHILSVGRLDLNSEGLLLLTNDGALARFLEQPSTGLKRTYRVRIQGTLDDQKCSKLRRGMVVDGVRYAPLDVVVEVSKGSSNLWVRMTLKEGKNREIRCLMEALECRVNRLIRLAYGPFSLGDLPRGGVIEVLDKDVQKLLAKREAQK